MHRSVFYPLHRNRPTKPPGFPEDQPSTTQQPSSMSSAISTPLEKAQERSSQERSLAFRGIHMFIADWGVQMWDFQGFPLEIKG